VFVFIKGSDIENIALDMKRDSTSKYGMTLIEVLLALVIITIALLPLMTSMTQLLVSIHRARALSRAQELIRQVDVENPLQSKKMEALTESGSFEDVPGYSWTRTVEAVDEEERPGLFLVTTRVSWNSTSRDAWEEVTAYRYAPDAERVKKKF